MSLNCQALDSSIRSNSVASLGETREVSSKRILNYLKFEVSDQMVLAKIRDSNRIKKAETKKVEYCCKKIAFL